MKRLYNTPIEDTVAHIEIFIDVEEPIDLTDFVTSFTSLSNSFHRYMKMEFPEFEGEARIFVKEMRAGSIIADLLPGMISLIGHMDQVLIVDQFIHRYGERLAKYFTKGGRAEGATKTELKDFMGQVAAIANNRNGKGQVRSVTYKDGIRQVRAHIEFNHKDAQRAIKEIENHSKEMDSSGEADYERVLMVFKRPDFGDVSIGKPSGERVVIEEIDPRPCPIMYGSSLAEEYIKHILRDPAINAFYQGFVVDVKVIMRSGRVGLYNIINVHEAIDMEDN